MSKETATILKGTAVLTIAGLIVKMLGAVYRIPLARLIGDEGIGLYQMAYPIYLIFLSLSNAGIPIAISRIIAKQVSLDNYHGIKQVFRASLCLTICLGLSAAIGMALAAESLAKYVVADARAVYAMWALAPGIFFMSMMAGFRGYFQGWQEMTPSAISQVVEQIVRIVVALVLAVLLLKSGIEHAAAGAAFGATAGGAAGLIYLIFCYLSKHRKLPVFKSKIIKNQLRLHQVIWNLIKYALPISIATVLMPLLQALDSVIVPSCLQKIGYTISQATAMLGVLGNSWAVLYLPLIVTTALSSNMVPALAGFEKRNQELLVSRIEEGYRLAAIYLTPVMIVVFFGAESIYRIIYSTRQVEILAWFAPAILFLGLQQVSAGILQGLGRPNQPLYNFLAGALTKVAITTIATGFPGLNLAGAALGTVCGSGLTALLNFWAVRRLIVVRFPLKPSILLAALGMSVCSWYLQRLVNLPYYFELIVVSGLSCLIYLGILWLVGGITPRDLELLKQLKNGNKGDSLV